LGLRHEGLQKQPDGNMLADRRRRQQEQYRAIAVGIARPSLDRQILDLGAAQFLHHAALTTHHLAVEITGCGDIGEAGAALLRGQSIAVGSWNFEIRPAFKYW